MYLYTTPSDVDWVVASMGLHFAFFQYSNLSHCLIIAVDIRQVFHHYDENCPAFMICMSNLGAATPFSSCQSRTKLYGELSTLELIMGKEDSSTLNVFDVFCLCCITVTTFLHSLLTFSLFCFIIVALHIRHGLRRSWALNESWSLRARGLRKEREGDQRKKRLQVCLGVWEEVLVLTGYRMYIGIVQQVFFFSFFFTLGEMDL